MKQLQTIALASGILLALVTSDGAALETRRTWNLGPQEQQSYDQPTSGRARDILDNRFEGRRPAREEGSYDQQPPLGPHGEVMDGAARQQWEKEQRIRGFRQERQEEYGSEPSLSEEDGAQLEGEEQPQADPNDPVWQEELRRRNPIPPGMQPR